MFLYVNFNKCRKKIIYYEDRGATPNIAQHYSKESKPDALDFLHNHFKNLQI